jgi:hypothetical protein
MLLNITGTDNNQTDINRLFAETVARALCLAFLYTIFGFVFCHVHAERISAEMALFSAKGLTPVINSDDPNLLSLMHQLGAGSFFGLTLGLLIGIAGAVAGVILWFVPLSPKLWKSALIIFSMIIAVCACIFGFSRELPAVSIIFGIMSPFVFFLPWLMIAGKRKKKEIPKLPWVVCILIICTPLILIKGQSYELIRDAMADTPVLSSINNFYYENTLLAADVIKPLRFRTQNAIAVTNSIEEISQVPSGSLFIITPEPCSVKGAVIAVSTQKLTCRAVVVSDGSKTVSAASILGDDASDLNKMLRNGIGTFLKGPIIAVPLIILGWISFGLACLFRKKPYVAAAVMLCYLALLVPAFNNRHLKNELYASPSKIHEYVSSSSSAKRYLTMVYMLDKKVEHTDGLYPDELRLLAKDTKATTRLNALVFAGNLKNAEFSDMVSSMLDDKQLNVRTKAVWAMGRIGGDDAAGVLYQVLKNDPSWYVRDYAYNSLSKIKPESLVIKKG